MTIRTRTARPRSVRAVLGAIVVVGALALAAVVPATATPGQRAARGIAFVTLEAELTGANEVPGPGDPDGAGVAQVNLTKSGALCFAIAVDNITLPATAAHIHQGAADVAGPIVVFFTPPQPFGSGVAGASAGCLTDVSRSLLRAIASDPGGFYVNVHTTDFPGGAVRGQLAPA
jgi:hypothetical protein